MEAIEYIKNHEKFLIRALVLSALLAFIIPMGFCVLGSNYKIMIDPQVDKCLPGKTVYLVDLKDKTPEKGVPFAFKAKGIERFIDEANPVIEDLRKYYTDGSSLLKVIDGLPGELVKITDTDVLINGEAVGVGGLDLYKTLRKEKSYFTNEYVLAEDEYFFAGRTNNSFDSRYWGPVNEVQIIGKAYALF